MAHSEVFECPSCAAPLRAEGGVLQVRCPYCGNTVIVPPELRPAPPPPVYEPPVYEPPTIEVVLPPSVYQRGLAARPRPARRRGCGCFGWLISLIVIAGAVGAGYAVYREPYLLQNLMPNSQGRIALTFGGPGTGPGLFQEASGVAVDSAGIVYVSDSKSHRISKFDAQGRYLDGWTFESNDPWGGGQLAADRSGNVYLAWGYGIFKFDGATGREIARFHSKRDDSFLTDRYEDLAVLLDGSLWAIDADNGDLLHFSPDGAVLSRVPNPITAQGISPEASPHLAVDGLGQIFVLAPFNDTVLHLTADGTFINRFGSAGDADDQFDFPVEDITVDNQSRVYVSDWKGILVFDPTGRYLGRIPKWGATPDSMAIDAQNNLYGAQSYQSRVVKITLTAPTPQP